MSLARPLAMCAVWTAVVVVVLVGLALVFAPYLFAELSASLEPHAIIDPAKPDQVIQSTRAYDTSVAGVVSAQPGLILGQRGAGKESIATTGRVKVHVDARRAAVHIGDLLVTSDVAGMAMRSEPMMINGRAFHQPGTIVGKALEPLDGGVGEILVLLSLQ